MNDPATIGAALLGARACPDRESRVQYIAGLIADSQWRGHNTRSQLARLWDVTGPTVDAMHHEASVLVTTGYGDLPERLAFSMARWANVFDAAMVPSGESGENGKPDLKAAAAAQAGWDRAAGVVQPAQQTVNVSIVQDPRLRPLLMRMKAFVERHMGDEGVALLREDLREFSRSPEARALPQATNGGQR